MPIHNPDSTTETSPSLISRVKRLSESGSINKAKRAKGDREPEVQEEDRQGIQQAVGKQWEGRHTQPDLIKRTSTRLGSQSFKKVPLDSQVQSTQNGTSNQRPDVSCASPAFKKPDVKEANKDGFWKKGNPLQDLNASHLQPEGEDGEFVGSDSLCSAHYLKGRALFSN